MLNYGAKWWHRGKNCIPWFCSVCWNLLLLREINTGSQIGVRNKHCESLSHSGWEINAECVVDSMHRWQFPTWLSFVKGEFTKKVSLLERIEGDHTLFFPPQQLLHQCIQPSEGACVYLSGKEYYMDEGMNKQICCSQRSSPQTTWAQNLTHSPWEEKIALVICYLLAMSVIPRRMFQAQRGRDSPRYPWGHH